MNLKEKVLVGSGLLMSSALAMAQTTDPFDGAITALTAKVTSYGGALVTLAAVGVGFFVAIKYVKKITRAA
jgi:hypothetical protein